MTVRIEIVHVLLSSHLQYTLRSISFCRNLGSILTTEWDMLSIKLGMTIVIGMFLHSFKEFMCKFSSRTNIRSFFRDRPCCLNLIIVRNLR